MGKNTKLGVAIVLAAGVIAVIVMTAAKRGNKAVEVKTESVTKHDLVASVTASGQVRPETKVDVASDVSGKITKLSVKEGQMVSAGQFLLQIDPSLAQADVQRAELAQAQANLDGAQKSYDRTAQIKKQNPQLIADEQVEQLKTAVDVDAAVVESAKHSVDQAVASYDNAKSSLDKTTIFAPMAGRV